MNKLPISNGDQWICVRSLNNQHFLLGEKYEVNNTYLPDKAHSHILPRDYIYSRLQFMSKYVNGQILWETPLNEHTLFLPECLVTDKELFAYKMTGKGITDDQWTEKGLYDTSLCVVKTEYTQPLYKKSLWKKIFK